MATVATTSFVITVKLHAAVDTAVLYCLLPGVDKYVVDFLGCRPIVRIPGIPMDVSLLKP